MKTLDIFVAALLVIGGLNWGLVGVFDIDLIETIFGPMTIISRLLYVLVGLAAVYDLVAIRSIQKRWNLHFHRPAHA